MLLNAEINRKQITINTNHIGTKWLTMISTSANYYGKEVYILKKQ